MALQRSLLLCGLLWWHEGVAMPLGPPSPAVSRPFPTWDGGGRPRMADPPSNRRGYHPQPMDRGASQQVPSYRDNRVNQNAAGRRLDFGRSGNEHSYWTRGQNDRHEISDRYREPLNRYESIENNIIRKKTFLARGDENSSFQRLNNIRYKGNDLLNDRPRVEGTFATSDSFRRRTEEVNENTQRRKYAPKEESYSPNARHDQRISNGFNGGGSYTRSNEPAAPQTISPRYHFIENAKTGRESNFMNHHHPSSSNERHFRFLSDGFRGPISSGHYEDVPGTSGGYYRRPGGLTNNDVTSSYQSKAPRPLLQASQVWQDRQRGEEFPYREAERNTQGELLKRTHRGYHQSYFKDSATTGSFRSDKYQQPAQRQQEEHQTIPIQPKLLVKEVELPNPQPLHTSSHHPYSLLYFHYLPRRN